MANTYDLIGKLIETDASSNFVGSIPFDLTITGDECNKQTLSFGATQSATSISLGTITTATVTIIKARGTFAGNPTFKFNGGTTAFTLVTGGCIVMYNVAVTAIVLDWTRSSGTLILDILTAGA